MNEFHLILSNPHFACRLGNRKAKFKLIQTLEFPIGSKDYPPLGNRKLALINKSTPMTENELTYFKLMAASNKTSKAKSRRRIPRQHHIFRVIPMATKTSDLDPPTYLFLDCKLQDPKSISSNECKLTIDVITYCSVLSPAYHNVFENKIIGQFSLDKDSKGLFQRRKLDSLSNLRQFFSLGQKPLSDDLLPFSVRWERGVCMLHTPNLPPGYLFGMKNIFAPTLSSLATLILSRELFNQAGLTMIFSLEESAQYLLKGIEAFKRYFLKAGVEFCEVGKPRPESAKVRSRCMDMRSFVDTKILLEVTEVFLPMVEEIVTQFVQPGQGIAELTKKDVLQNSPQFGLVAAKGAMQLHKLWLAMSAIKYHKEEIAETLHSFETNLAPKFSSEFSSVEWDVLRGIFSTIPQFKPSEPDHELHLRIRDETRVAIMKAKLPKMLIPKYQDLKKPYEAFLQQLRQLGNKDAKENAGLKSQMKVLHYFQSAEDCIVRKNFYPEYIKEMILRKNDEGRWRINQKKDSGNNQKWYSPDFSVGNYMTLLSLDKALEVTNKQTGICSVVCKPTEVSLNVDISKKYISGSISLKGEGYYSNYNLECYDRKRSIGYYTNNSKSIITMLQISSTKAVKPSTQVKFVHDIKLTTKENVRFSFASLKLDIHQQYFVLQAVAENKQVYIRLIKNNYEKGLPNDIQLEKVPVCKESEFITSNLQGRYLMTNNFSVTDRHGLFIYSRCNETLFVGYKFDEDGNVTSLTTKLTDPKNHCTSLYLSKINNLLRSESSGVLAPSSRSLNRSLYAYLVPSDKCSSPYPLVYLLRQYLCRDRVTIHVCDAVRVGTTGRDRSIQVIEEWTDRLLVARLDIDYRAVPTETVRVRIYRLGIHLL